MLLLQEEETSAAPPGGFSQNEGRSHGLAGGHQLQQHLHQTLLGFTPRPPEETLHVIQSQFLLKRGRWGGGEALPAQLWANPWVT